MSVPDTRANEHTIGLALGFTGVGLATLALFLPYVDEASAGSFARVAENTLLQSDLGWTNLVLLGLAGFGLVRNILSPHRVIWPLVLGCLLIGFAVFAGVSESQRTLCPLGQTSITEQCSVAEPGLGVYVLALGGGVLVLSGLFLVRQRGR
jgi:hypothetical protein